MFSAQEITDWHRTLVVRWHQQEAAADGEGFLRLVSEQFRFNFLLWHEEDIARSQDVSDARIATVKRAIDKYNQQRNDYIEKLDDAITEELEKLGVTPVDGARQNTETAGSVIDRLSILALRIYHLEEQRDRSDATPEHRENVAKKLAIALVQLEDLRRGLAELKEDLFSGRKRHKTYRQLKMYNDPTMNPYLYAARNRGSETVY